MKIFLYYNDFAGGKRARKKRYEVLKALREENFLVELYLTKDNKKSIEEIKNKDLSPYDAFVIAGGDGTIWEAINAYIPNPTEQKPPLAFLPLGTGNAFVRDINLQTGDILSAIGKLKNKNIQPVDAAWVKTSNEAFYYLNIIGIGFVSDVTQTAQKFKFLGNIAYTIGVFIEALRLKDQHVNILIDGKKQNFNINFIEVSNTQYTSNFFIAPKAQFNDGLLDIVILKKLNFWKLLASFPKIFDGSHLEMNEITYYQANEIQIETQQPKVATPDGEIRGYSPLHIKCLKHALKIYA